MSWLWRTLPWACRDADTFDLAKQEGRILVYRAVMTFDGRTTLAGWIIATLQGQLKFRIREAQGLQGVPEGQVSLDEADDDGRTRDVEDRGAAAWGSEAGRRALAEKLGRAVAEARAMPRLRLYGIAARRAIVRALFVRAWGRVDRRARATERALRWGCRREDLEAMEAEWRKA